MKNQAYYDYAEQAAELEKNSNTTMPHCIGNLPPVKRKKRSTANMLLKEANFATEWQCDHLEVKNENNKTRLSRATR